MENIQRDEEEEQEESDDDEGNESTVSAVKKFAINNGMSAAVTDVASAETVMERKFLQRRNNATHKNSLLTIFKLLGQLFYSIR